jgi:virginiamycin A acetyltransferase
MSIVKGLLARLSILCYKFLLFGNKSLQIIESQGFKLSLLDHPYALNNRFVNSYKEENSFLYPVYHIQDCKIGDYTYIAQNSIINRTTIGKFCSIGPNFMAGWGIHPIHSLSTHPMFYSTQKQCGVSLTNEDKIRESLYITIGNDVFIGRNVIVLDGIEIGDGAVIGAGAVVSKNIPAYAVAVGNPIKIIKYRFTPAEIESLLKIKWWNWPKEDLQNIESYFDKVEEFITKFS